MRRLLRKRDGWLFALGGLMALLAPQFFTTGYAHSVMVVTAIFVILALSYDLSVGHVGTVHLAVPAFFGLGAYVTALVGTPLRLGFVGNVTLSVAVMALFALVVGVPSFRLSHVTFAIGTLAFAVASQQVINSAVDLTRGPLCVLHIPRPEFAWPGIIDLRIVSAVEYYYLLLPMVLITILVYRALTRSRIGRAFAAVRDDEVLAAASGLHPLRYKMLAFVVGAAIAGGLGSFQAQYLTVVCPTELSGDYTIRLLIIVFVGGAGSLGGLLVAAIVFTVLPELLRSLGNIQITPAHQLVIFGFILLVAITYAPGGLRELFGRWRRVTSLRRLDVVAPENEGGATS